MASAADPPCSPTHHNSFVANRKIIIIIAIGKAFSDKTLETHLLMQWSVVVIIIMSHRTNFLCFDYYTFIYLPLQPTNYNSQSIPRSISTCPWFVISDYLARCAEEMYFSPALFHYGKFIAARQLPTSVR